MLEIITLPLLGTAIASFFLSWFIGFFLVGQLSARAGLLATFAVSTAIGYYFAGTATLPFVIVALAPLWIPAIGVVLWSIIGPQLAKRGYLGRVTKWENNHTFSAEGVAAKLLLDVEEIEEVQHVSASAEDYEQNLIQAAGLEDHETDTDFL